MALELLAGPFTVTNKLTGDTEMEVAGGSYPIWVDGRGLMLCAGGDVLIVQMDGAAYPVRDVGEFIYCLALTGAGTDPLSRRREYGMMTVFSGVNAIDPVSMYLGSLISEDGLGLTLNAVLLHDRVLRFSGSILRSSPSLTAPVWTIEATITGMSGSQSASWGTLHQEIVIGCTSGQVIRYDWLAKAPVGGLQTIGMTCIGVWWSAMHGVYISLHDAGTTLEMRIWAATVQPASVSDPTPDAALTAGRRTRVRARVMGAHSDPCAGEVVAWSLIGSGALTPSASLTDSDGYAETFFEAPIASGGAGIEVVAEVAI